MSLCTELMQTEMHHVRTLKIMLCVYVHELKENLQMDSGRTECLFPRLENLLELHTHFLSRLKERRRENLLSPGERNYSINKLADILIAQVWRGQGVSYTHAHSHVFISDGSINRPADTWHFEIIGIGQ